MNRNLLITAGLLVVVVVGVYAFNRHQKNKFNKDCIAQGGRIIKSGSTCELK